MNMVKDTGGCSVVVSTVARQAKDPGSIPGTCFVFFKLVHYPPSVIEAKTVTVL